MATFASMDKYESFTNIAYRIIDNVALFATLPDEPSLEETRRAIVASGQIKTTHDMIVFVRGELIARKMDGDIWGLDDLKV